MPLSVMMLGTWLESQIAVVRQLGPTWGRQAEELERAVFSARNAASAHALTSSSSGVSVWQH